MTGSTSAGKIDTRIDRDDIEAKFREIRDEVDEAAGSMRTIAIAVGAVVAVAVVGLAFWTGKRRGRKATTIVEVRRF